MTQILQPTPENIGIASAALLAGELVAMPTETVYGLAGNAFSPEALARIFNAKERPTFDPLIVHVAQDWSALERLEEEGVIDLSSLNARARECARELIHRFWPGPLTLVLPKGPNIPDLATSGLPTVAVRMPRHPVAQGLLAAAGIPLAAPSANRFGRISPTTAQSVLNELDGRIPWIIDGGPSTIGVESTVLALSPEGTPTLLRPGGISKLQLERTLSAPVQAPAHAPGGTAPLGPGMLSSHYAPRKPLSILSAPLGSLNPAEIRDSFFGLPEFRPFGLLLMQGDPGEAEEILRAAFSESGNGDCRFIVKSLSTEGDLEEIARNLFSAMRTLDDSAVTERLICEPCPSEEGIGHAVADRLQRASARRA